MFHNEPKKTDGVGWDGLQSCFRSLRTHHPPGGQTCCHPRARQQLKETALLVSKRHRTSISNYLEGLPVCLFDTRTRITGVTWVLGPKVAALFQDELRKLVRKEAPKACAPAACISEEGFLGDYVRDGPLPRFFLV